MRCNAKQANTPCVYKKGDECLLRRSNCTGRPCTEGPHEPTACDAVVPSLSAAKRVCLDVKGLVPDAVIRVFKEEQMSETAYGPASAPHVRMCTSADRAWRIEANDRDVRKVTGALDWSKSDCHTLDLDAQKLDARCTKYTGVEIENRL